MFKLTRHLIKSQLTRRLYTTDVNPLQGTLHMRFLDHLSNQNKNSMRNDSKLSAMLDLFHQQPLQAYSPEFKSRFKVIEQKTLEIVNQPKISNSELMSLMNELILKMPASVTNLSFYNEATQMLVDRFKKKPNRELFVKLCFYLGLFKKKPPGPEILEKLLEKSLDQMMDAKLTEMSSIDLAIICMAAYKASVRVNSDKFIQRIIKEITKTKEIDDQIFIAFIKTLRLNKINSPKVVNTLKELHGSGQLARLDYNSLIHVFPLLADNGIVDNELSSFFVQRSIETFTNNTRAKDVQKLLYSCALLNFQPSPDQFQILQKTVMNRTSHKEFAQKFDNFVDIALSMWILNFRCQDLIEKLKHDKRFSFYPENQSRVKIDSRKKLLKSCLEIEEPGWIEKNEFALPAYNQEREAPGYLVRKSLEKAKLGFEGQDVKIVQQIKNLNIAGILVKEDDGRLVNVEILDETNSLADKTSPNGIFALKLRLLKAKGCEVKVLNFVSR